MDENASQIGERRTVDGEKIHFRGTANALVLTLTDSGQLEPDRVKDAINTIRTAVSNYSQPVVVLNLEKIRFVHSISLGHLISLNCELTAANRAVHLCNVQPDIENVLQVTGLHRVLKIFPDEMSAIG